MITVAMTTSVTALRLMANASITFSQTAWKPKQSSITTHALGELGPRMELHHRTQDRTVTLVPQQSSITRPQSINHE